MMHANSEDTVLGYSSLYIERQVLVYSIVHGMSK